MNKELIYTTLEITKRCNFGCSFCYSASNRQCNNELAISEEKFETLINQIKKIGIKKVVLSGGEPLVDSKLLFKLTRSLHDLHIDMNLNTNLALMTKEFADLIKSTIGDYFYVFSSLLSANPKTCDKITNVNGSYDNIINGIKICKRNGLKVSINMTISKQNIDELDLICNFIQKYDIDRFSISKVIPPSYDRLNDINYLSNHDIIRIADTLLVIHDKFHIPVSSNTPLPLCIIGDDSKYSVIESATCMTGVNTCAINIHTGSVFACSQEETTYGNIYVDDLYNIWNTMKETHGENNLKQKCIDCSILKKCGGECKWSGCKLC